MKITFHTLIKILAVVSIVAGVLGIISFTYYRNQARQKFEAEQKNKKPEEEKRSLRPKLIVIPSKISTAAGEQTTFNIELSGPDGPISAENDLVILIRPTPSSITYKYTGEKGAAVIVQKTTNETTAKYIETKAGEYTLIFSADGLEEGSAKLEIMPGSADSLSISGPDSTSLSTISSGITLTGAVFDKYKNKITEGIIWSVSKNGEGLQELGNTESILYSDSAASSCDIYVFTFSAGGKSRTKSVAVTDGEEGDCD